jgi:hypothetical protein
MRTIIRIAIAVAAGLATLFAVTPMAGAITEGNVSTIQATTIDLGGLDLIKYCKSLGYDTSDHVNDSASGWRCKEVNGTLHEISMADACNWQFLDLLIDGISVNEVSTGGLGGWRCYSNPARGLYLDGMDLNRYCMNIGYSGVILVESNVSGWRCQDSNGTLHEINMHAACRSNNPSLVNAGFSVVSRFGSYGDEFGIKCAALRNF